MNAHRKMKIQYPKRYLFLIIPLLLLCGVFRTPVFAEENGADAEVIRVGFYGQASYFVDELAYRFNLLNDEYTVEAIDYGEGEEGLTHFMADISSGDNVDMVVCDGYQLNNSDLFTDLYPLLDNDETINREDFFPFILDGLEKDGELRQIWGFFGMSSVFGVGALQYGPDPFKLLDCPGYLASLNLDDPLFDNDIPREQVLYYFIDTMLRNAYNEESGNYELDTQEIREILALCKQQPSMDSLLRAVDQPHISGAIMNNDNISLEFMKAFEKGELPYRFFDGKDGGDTYTCLSAYYKSCYAIPNSCRDKERAWGFLRHLLMEDYQTETARDGYHGYPINRRAFHTVCSAFVSGETEKRIIDAAENAILVDFDVVQIRNLFFQSINTYLNGDYDLDRALEIAQGKLKLYTAEHKR